MEKQLNSTKIYDGKVIRVKVDDVLLEDGKTSKREVVMHNGGACIAIKDTDDKYFMVKQYRYALGKDMIEFCAGKIEIGEDPDNTVLREAEEEVGYTVKNVVKFGYMVPTCGYCTEKIYLYYGEVDKKINQNFDEDEDINTLKYSFAEIKEMINNGTIDDGKTICLAYHLIEAGIEK